MVILTRFQVGSFILAALIVLTASVEYVVLLLSSPFLHEYVKLVVLGDMSLLILCHSTFYEHLYVYVAKWTNCKVTQ